MDFVHLHTHSEYSLLDGLSRIDDLISLAGQMGMKALALTDHGVMHGVIPFYLKAKEKGIKPIIGCEVYVAPRTRFDKEGKMDQAYHLVLLVKDEEGYRNLLYLVSQAYLEGFYYRPRVDKDLLRQYSSGLIALSSCLQGEIPKLLLQGGKEEAKKAALEYEEIFGKGNFYLEVQNHGIEDERIYQREMIELSEGTGIPLVATNDSHYSYPSDYRTHDILLCIGTGKTLEDKDRLSFENDQFYFKSPQEMEKAFSFCPQALENTVKIAEACHMEIDLGHLYLPKFSLPEDYDADGFLREKAEEGILKRYPEIDPEVRARLDHELETIKKMGFASYFLVVWDMVEFARGQGIMVGPGRGSVCGSLVAYALGITEIDPLHYNLFFERFLNPERITMPDFDIDFCSKRRDEVISYLKEKYGSDNVAQIATFGTMAARAAVRDCGRVLRVPLWKVDKIAKMIPFNASISQALATVEDLHQEYEKDPQVKELLDSAKGLEGIARHASTHAAGVVISPDLLIKYVPLMLGPEGAVTTQFEKDAIERIGLLKMDVLGLSTLTMVRDTLEMIKERHGLEIDWQKIPLDDEKTFKMLAQAETSGVFQLESAGMRRILKDLKPERVEDIIAVVALFRPGPMPMIDDFIKRKNGRIPIEYLHPALEPVLKETYGAIVYQEQVMQIASNLAGYTLSEADTLRRAMGKKDRATMEKHKPLFINRASANGVPPEKAAKIFDFMEEFALYGFNKSHATAYGILAYRTAYLKAHFPLEFMSALLSSVMSDEKKVRAYIEECHRCGIRVNLPNINEGEIGFRPRGTNEISFGLAAIKNVGEGAVEAIMKERVERGPFQSLHDFLSRVTSRLVTRKTVESLIKAGAFDFTNKPRPTLLSQLDLFHGQKKSTPRMRQATLFFAEPKFEESKEEINETYSESEVLRMEKEVLGFYLSEHPMARYQDLLSSYSLSTIATLSEMDDGAEVLVAGIKTKAKSINTKNGAQMLFLTIEDLSGSLEVRVRPKLYPDFSTHLDKEGIFVIRGKLELSEDEVKVDATSLEAFLDSEALEVKKSSEERKDYYLNLTIPKDASYNLLLKLKDVLENYPGKCPVTIYIPLNGKKVVIAPAHRFWVQNEPRLILKLKNLLGEDNVRTGSF